jgi:formate--tetrahydrofolate ligase
MTDRSAPAAGAQSFTTRPIQEVARGLGIDPKHVVPYGDDKAKIRLAARDSGRAPGKLILVSAITPTDAGEGKTTVSIGLAQGLHRIGQRVALALREPSLGPVFGVKGGATGGGKSVLVPATEINLHFTGDFHAITAANNLLVAMLDNSLHQGNPLGIDARKVLFKRVMDVNDRSLRKVLIGLGGPSEGVPREASFDITAASEVMASFCLARDAEDLRARLSRLLVALTFDGKPVTAADLGAVGSMMVLLKDALMPNLVQTCEGVPAFVHGGPFANIAHGCNSVIATTMALAHADWVVTEAGFASDLGAEKFFDIKCQSAGLDPAATVLVVTVRALKRHGGVLKADLAKPDAAAVERGLPNLEKHVENMLAFGKPVIVAINRFATDTEEELAVIEACCARIGARVARSDHFAQGGPGAVALAETVVAAASAPTPRFQPVYDWSEAPRTKIEKIATRIYGADGVAFTAAAERDLKQIKALGFEGLPICMAKTQSSLSDDAKLVGRPRGFTVTVRGVVIAAGAGFLVPLCGEIMRMPGLPPVPQATKMDLVDGEIVGMLGV